MFTKLCLHNLIMSQNDENKKEEGGYLYKIANFFVIAESLVKIVYNVSRLYFEYQTHKNRVEDDNNSSAQNSHSQSYAADRGSNERSDNQSPPYPLNPPEDTKLPEEGDDEKDACKVCLTNKIRTVNLPCGHLVFCFACTRNFITNNFQHNCPICRVKITEIKMIYNM